MTDEIIEKISAFERQIIFSMLQGGNPILDKLKSQIDDLLVLQRKIEKCRYAVEFSHPECKGNGSSCPSISIMDQHMSILQTNNVLHAELTVINGTPRYFHIGGQYDFEKEMTIKELFWDFPDPETGRSLKYVYSAEERNFDLAIGYIPTYK